MPGGPSLPVAGAAEANRTKYDNGLFQVARAVRSVRERGWGLNAVATQAVSAEVAGLVREKIARFDGNNVQVYIEWTSPAARDVAAVQRAGGGVEIEDTARAITQASVPIATLDQIEALPNVKRVRLPEYPVRNAGSQQTEGDGLLRFSNLRTLAGVDGTGVTIGVISDGIAGLQTAIGLGDLPASTETRNGSSVLTATSGGVIAQSFRSDSDLEAGSEGTAMLEIVHDIAPGAQLRFANFYTSIEFNAAVNFLASVSDVVVDDIGWLGMPIDGTSTVSANTSAALNNNANPIRSYATSVGNQALRHYRDPYLSSGVDITARALGTTAGGAPFAGNMTLFRATAQTSDQGSGASSVNNAIRVQPGSTVTVEMQWDDTWGASANDYNLAVTWTNGGFYNLIASSTFVQNGNDDPLERVTFTNTTGSVQHYDIRVWNQNNAAATKNINLMVAGSVDTVTDFTSSSMLWLTLSSSLLAQSDAGGGVISVGAIAALDAGTDTIEGYSSNGPTLDGRTKPDVTAIDGVAVTGAGGFFNPFYGTSAAAPHVAGLAALLLDAHPRLQSDHATPEAAATARTALRSIITGSAIDLGASGIDNIYGSGRVDGVTAFTTAGPADQLSYSAAPAFAVTGSLQPQPVENALFYTQPVVEILDAIGNIVTSSTAAVTIAIKSGTGTPGASLLGTTTRNAVNGVATFTDLKIDRPGTGYVLVATTTGSVTSVESAAFDVVLGTTGQAFTAVAGGGVHACALASNGTAFCWGNNTYGQLGNTVEALDNQTATPTLLPTATPVAVALGTTATAVSASAASGCALTTAGGVRCWGNHGAGILGRAASDPDPVPGDVGTLGSGVAAISMGGNTACAVTSTGGAKCWGYGTHGNIGNGTAVQDNVIPQDVTGLTSGVSNVTVGWRHACAVTTSGGLKCWGENWWGQLGDPATATGTINGIPIFSTVPVDVSGLSSGVSSVALGSEHSCAILIAGTVKCWGRNDKGQVGDGTTTERNAPVDVPGLSGVASLGLSGNGTCAVLTTGGIKCWGDNTYGQLGNGSAVTHSVTPVDVTGISSGATAVSGAGTSFCAIQSGLVKCWGNNDYGQLGDGTQTVSNVPVALNMTAPTLTYTTQPAGATAGNNLGTQPVVKVTDADGNVLTTASGSVTLSIKSGTGAGGATLQGTTTVALVSGVATFTNLRIDNAASGYVLVASMSGATSAESSAFTITAAAASTLAFVTPPSGAVTGAFGGAVPAAIFTTQPVVQVRDGFGNVITGATNSIAVAIKGGTGTGGAVLSGTTTRNAVAGVATFTDLRINLPGTGYVLTATSTGLAPADSAAFNVTLGAAHHLTVTTDPAAAAGGTAFGTQPVIEVRDGDQNVITGSSAAITASIKSGTGTSGAALTGTTTVNAASGIATFTNLKIDKVGTGYKLVFSGAGFTVESAAFDVTAGAPVTIEFVTNPAGAVTGAFGGAVPAAVFTTQPTVRLLDAGGNVATGATNAVTLAIKSGTGTGGASLLGTNPRNAVAGVATFTDLRIDRPGTGYVLTASVTGLTSVDGGSFNVTQGAAVAISVQTHPAGAAAGAAFTTQPVVHILDGDGNVVTTSSATVTAVIRGGTGPFGATLSGTTSVNASSGVATFTDLRIDKAGTGYQVTFRVNGLPVQHSNAFNVTAGAASKLVIDRQPSGGIAGATLTGQPVVRVTDSVGNTVASNVPVTLAIKSGTGAGGAVLGGTNPRNSNTPTNGTATFTDLSINLAGTGYVLTASSPGLTSVDSDAFPVRPAAVAIDTAPVAASGGALFATPPAVKIRDAGGDVNEHVFFHAAIKAGTGTPGAMLLGTATVEALNGTATFSDLRIDKAGTGYVIVFSVSTTSVSNALVPNGLGPVGLTAAAGDDAAPVLTPPFDVPVGAATGLAFSTHPGSTTPAALLSPQPVVSVVDAGGNAVPTATNTITLIVTGNAAPLSGTTAIAAVNGTATFFDLSIASVGSSYTLTASTGGLPSAASGAFNVTTPPAPGGGGGGGGGSVGGGGGSVAGGGGGVVAGPPLSIAPGGVSVATLYPGSVELDVSRPSVINATIAALPPGATDTVQSTARLDIPTGAMPGAAMVWLKPVASMGELEKAAPPSGQTIVTAMLLGAFDADERLIEIKQFTHPVTLSIVVPTTALPAGEDGSKIVISLWDGKTWQDIKTDVRRDGGSFVVSTVLEHFSTYAVMYNGTAGPPKPAASTSTGAFMANAVFSPSGQAFVVYGGGSSTQLEAAAKTAGATGVWAQDARGTFRLLVVGGPAFLRSEFDAAFPAGFTSAIAMTLVR